uniref:Uncharacterized protein n=1 Tax=Anopheles culicifacies TaxID=139723 RepID=A0A182LX39_9DIPT
MNNNSSRSHLPWMFNNSLAIRQEIQRFESVHPSIYAIYHLIDLIPDVQVAQQIRDHVVCIEDEKVDKEPSMMMVTVGLNSTGTVPCIMDVPHASVLWVLRASAKNVDRVNFERKHSIETWKPVQNFLSQPSTVRQKATSAADARSGVP